MPVRRVEGFPILLDTHIWVWWLLGSDRLSKQERAALNSLASRGALHLSAVSLWEAQMLHAKSRLTLNRPFDTWIRDAAAADVVQIVPLDVEVVIALTRLPASFHGDPADRLIVATSRAHRIPLATHDREMRITSWRTTRKSRTTTVWRAG